MSRLTRDFKEGDVSLFNIDIDKSNGSTSYCLEKTEIGSLTPFKWTKRSSNSFKVLTDDEAFGYLI